MPKKTKKEKIIAQLRRKLETVSLDQKPEVRSVKLDNEMGSEKMEISLRNIPLPNPTSHVQLPASLPYIMRDLRKTFFLAGLAISLEVVLYLIWR